MMSCLKDFPIKGKSFGQPSAYKLKEREKMTCIRPAEAKDICRLSEIEVFNYRLNFYPIFLNDEFYFSEYTVENLTSVYHQNPEALKNTCVYDDGCVKGFIRVSGNEVQKLFVEPAFQKNGIGTRLLLFAVNEKNARMLWALEKNVRAIAFYERHGFEKTGDRKPEDDTDEYLIRLERR